MRVWLLNGSLHVAEGDEFDIITPDNINTPCFNCGHATADHGYYIVSCAVPECDCKFFVERERGQKSIHDMGK